MLLPSLNGKLFQRVLSFWRRVQEKVQHSYNIWIIVTHQLFQQIDSFQGQIRVDPFSLSLLRRQMSSQLRLESLRHYSLGMFRCVTFQFCRYHLDMSHSSLNKATMCISCSRAVQEHPVQSSAPVLFSKHTFFTFSTHPSSTSLHMFCFRQRRRKAMEVYGSKT